MARFAPPILAIKADQFSSCCVHYCFRIKRYRGKVDNVMFKHAQLETVKAWINDPANGSLPLHERIQRAIRMLILEGILSHGKALPASRALAASLSVSRDTIEAAYSSLHAEGFIERQTGRGSFVSSSARF